MRFFISFSLFVHLLFSLSLKDLPQKYRKWLEEDVYYIITKKERNIFLQFQTDKERDIFIEAFWAQRDPTPGTPQNEFKEEHYRRIEYANKFFGRDAPKPGWMTDRGRVYIILGEPMDKEIHEGSADVSPTEIWFYKGDVSRGLPSYFYVVFFKRNGTGEYVLYSPLKDGPESLVIDSKLRLWDRDKVLDHLRDMGGQLADVSLSLIPGESVSRDGSSLPLSSDVLLGKINDYQRSKIKDEYAEKILKYKEIVEVDYSVNYIESSSNIFLARDNKGDFFLHYVIEPKRLSLDNFQNKYFTSLKIYGSLRDSSGKNVFQFEKSIPIELKEEELNNLKGRPFSVIDTFPIISGAYNFSILVKNTVSKEFFSFERDINVSSVSDYPFLSPILIFYDRRTTTPSPIVRPFDFEGFSFYPDPKCVFSPSEKAGILCRAYNLERKNVKDLEWKLAFFSEEKEVFSKLYQFSQFPEISSLERDRIDQTFIAEVSMENLKPGDYEIRLSLMQKGKEFLSERKTLSIFPSPFVSKPWVVSKPTFTSEDSFLDYTLGTQYLNTGNTEEALKRFQTAHSKKPGSLEFSVALAKVYLLKKDWRKAIDILSPFLRSELKVYEPFYFVAVSHQNLGEFSQAIENYKKALSSKGLDPEILNRIGFCYLQLGDNEEAKRAFEKSLEIKSNQKDIETILNKLKGGEK